MFCAVFNETRYFSWFSPRAARASQPWSEWFNPFGIRRAKTQAVIFIPHSTGNSQKPLWFIPLPNIPLPLFLALE
jgi:hypothetical protein